MLRFELRNNRVMQVVKSIKWGMIIIGRCSVKKGEYDNIKMVLVMWKNGWKSLLKRLYNGEYFENGQAERPNKKVDWVGNGVSDGKEWEFGWNEKDNAEQEKGRGLWGEMGVGLNQELNSIDDTASVRNEILG